MHQNQGCIRLHNSQTMWPIAFEKSLVIDCPHNRFYLYQEIQNPFINHDVNLHNSEIVRIFLGLLAPLWSSPVSKSHSDLKFPVALLPRALHTQKLCPTPSPKVLHDNGWIYKQKVWKWTLKVIKRGWRNGSVVKSTGSSSGRPRFNFQHTHGNLTIVGNLASSRSHTHRQK